MFPRSVHEKDLRKYGDSKKQVVCDDFKMGLMNVCYHSVNSPWQTLGISMFGLSCSLLTFNKIITLARMPPAPSFPPPSNLVYR